MATKSASESEEDSAPRQKSGDVSPKGDAAVPRALRIAAGSAALVAGAILIWYTAQVLLVFFFAIFLAVFFSGLAQALHRRSSFTYRGSLAFVLLALFSCLLVAGCFVGPAVADQSASLSEAIVKAYGQIVTQLNQTSWGMHLFQAAQQAFSASKGDNLHSVLKFAGLGLHGLGGLVFALVIGIFLAADPKLYRSGFLNLFPQARQERMEEVLDELGFTLWWWLLAQLATMASVGILIGVGLTLLGVPLSGTLGLIAAILSFIPSLGPFISVIPALLLGVTISPMMVVWVALLYGGVQTLEANLITPLIQQRAISLPPALILGAELIMGLLLGGAGLMFATPLAAVALVLVNMLYIQDILHQPGSLPSEAREKRKKKA
jgi:predicted PurR-regulated permease PerM